MERVWSVDSAAQCLYDQILKRVSDGAWAAGILRISIVGSVHVLLLLSLYLFHPRNVWAAVSGIEYLTCCCSQWLPLFQFQHISGRLSYSRFMYGNLYPPPNFHSIPF
jgi:hypothetical protein